MFNPFVKSENLPPTSSTVTTGEYHLSSKNSSSSISPNSSSKLSVNSSISTSPCYQRQIENQSSTTSSVSTSSNSIDSASNQYSNFNNHGRYSANSESIMGYENIQAENYHNFQVNQSLQSGLSHGKLNLNIIIKFIWINKLIILLKIKHHINITRSM